MISKLKKRLIDSPEWIIFIGVFLVYWLVNKSYTGPAYLTDEIGYLANAALISGHVIDGANSWHAGYSFFLAPLFIIFSEPSHLWQAAMVLNAFLWAVSFLLLAWILKKLLTDLSMRQLVIALLISAVYPAWITMSGYIFATTAFVFVYLLSILSLLYWKPDKYWTIIPHCLLVGYLYWIHPLGLAVAIASFIVVGFVCIKARNYVPALFNLVLIVVLIITYNEFIDRWLVMLATPEGYSPLSQHYPDSERFISRLLNYEFWVQLIAKTIGHISYLIVSSFGLILFGFIGTINKSFQLFYKSKWYIDSGSNPAKQSIPSFLALSLMGVLAMSVIFASGSESRVDHWIYGRYIEMVVLPLLALGYLSLWKKKWLYGAALFVFISGLILHQVADMSADNNLINTIVFWPQFLIREKNFLYWMSIGAITLFLLTRSCNYSNLGNKLIVTFIAVCFLASAANSSIFHHHMISLHGKPSTFVDIIRKSYPPGTFIGFNPEGMEGLHIFQVQRYHLHLFYLYDYNFRRMSTEEWLNNCNGPYFSYNLNGLYEQEDVSLIGKDVHSNIYLLTKGDKLDNEILDISKSAEDIYPASGWSINYMLNFEGSQLGELPGPEGYYKDGSIYSTGAGGFVLIDPGKRLGPGKYDFLLRGDAIISNSSRVEILSGEKKHAKFDIKGNPGSDKEIIASGSLLLDEPVFSLEVRVYGGTEDHIRIDGYEIEYVSNYAE